MKSYEKEAKAYLSCLFVGAMVGFVFGSMASFLLGAPTSSIGLGIFTGATAALIAGFADKRLG